LLWIQISGVPNIKVAYISHLYSATLCSYIGPRHSGNGVSIYTSFFELNRLNPRVCVCIFKYFRSSMKYGKKRVRRSEAGFWKPFG